MEKIYLKNYKGFRDQIVNLEDVNFFVGENSTGKTSVLKIINLLSDNRFWFDFQFNSEEVELGYFEEIISKNSDEKFIQIGIERVLDFDSAKDKDEKIRVLLEFKPLDSVPSISKIKINQGDFDLFIKISAKDIKYKVKKGLNNSFEDWIKDFDFSGSYKKLDFPFKNLPFPILVDLITQENKDKQRDSKSRRFHQELLYTNYNWIAPIRAKPKRLYESYKINYSPEGDHTPHVLRDILSKSKNLKKVINALEKFGAESNLFDKIEVKELGKRNSSPFEINIKYKDVEMKLPNVGYGVSQSLPIIIGILSSPGGCFSIQQPEVHLHPRAQASFGSFLFKSVVSAENKFIIETHSDFTINRFRYELSNNKKKKDINSKILFFERSEKGNSIVDIKINEDGSYMGNVPDSYRDFFIDEELKLLEI